MGSDEGARTHVTTVVWWPTLAAKLSGAARALVGGSICIPVGMLAPDSLVKSGQLVAILRTFSPFWRQTTLSLGLFVTRLGHKQSHRKLESPSPLIVCVTVWGYFLSTEGQENILGFPTHFPLVTQANCFFLRCFPSPSMLYSIFLKFFSFLICPFPRNNFLKL